MSDTTPAEAPATVPADAAAPDAATDVTPPRLLVIGVYESPSAAHIDFHDLERNEDLNLFTEFNLVLLTHAESGDERAHAKPFEASSVRGASIGLVAGAALGVLFPPAALGIIAGGAAVGLLGAAAGGVIGHATHGSGDLALKELEAALPAGYAAVVVSTTDPNALDRITTALSGAQSVFHHAWDGTPEAAVADFTSDVTASADDAGAAPAADGDASSS